MATATNAQIIAGLYAAFFDRAPDAAGLSYWETQFTGTATVNTIASLFAAHPVFETTYGAMTDVEFVNAIYLNVLGAAGDANGVDYWVGQLKNGGADARANFVAKFVNDALTVDLSTFTNLTAAELAVAQSRQDTLTNKVNVGLYFAEKFGAASNITTTGDITKDPAYLAAQAAIKNVTADDSSVAAAQGRVDVAVGTSDPAGSLVGQNSELTAALVDLQAKVVAKDAALEALALATNAVSETPVTDAAALKDLVDDFKADGDVAILNSVKDATAAVAAAKSAVATTEKALTDARAEKTDVALKADVTAAQTAVNADSVAKALFAAVTTANAAVAASTDVAVLTSVQEALSAFTKAGGATTTSLTGVNTVATLLDAVNGVLSLKVGVAGATEASIAADQKTLVDGFLIDGAGAVGSNAEKVYSLTASSPATAAETALKNAITAVETRDTAHQTAKNAETAFESNTLGGNLRDAEALVTDRNDLIKSSTDAAAQVTKEQSDLVKVTAAFDAHTTATEKLAAAADAIAKLGYNTDGSLTADKDLFVADVTKVAVPTVIAAGFAAGDELFIGTQYKFGGATDATHTVNDLFAKGNASALEVFFEQKGTDTVVHVEAKVFANAAAVPTADIAPITLTGVTASTLTFENGFVHVA